MDVASVEGLLEASVSESFWRSGKGDAVVEEWDSFGAKFVCESSRDGLDGTGSFSRDPNLNLFLNLSILGI